MRQTKTTPKREDGDGMACSRHDLEHLPTGWSTCPLCEEERRIEARLEHMLTRDRRVEPW